MFVDGVDVKGVSALRKSDQRGRQPEGGPPCQNPPSPRPYRSDYEFLGAIFARLIISLRGHKLNS